MPCAVMRYPQEQVQEDARRSRRIAKSRELFEQQYCCEFSRDSILPEPSVLTCLFRGLSRTAHGILKSCLYYLPAISFFTAASSPSSVSSYIGKTPRTMLIVRAPHA